MLVAALGSLAFTAGRAGTPAPCAATVPAHAARGHAANDPASFDDGNRRLRVEIYWPRGTLVAGPLPDGGEMAHANADGSISAKVGWWRSSPRQLTVSGRRLDRPAPPLRADVAPAYSYGAFLPSILTFPTTGCWRVEGRVGGARLAFVVRVTRRTP